MNAQTLTATIQARGVSAFEADLRRAGRAVSGLSVESAVMGRGVSSAFSIVGTAAAAAAAALTAVSAAAVAGGIAAVKAATDYDSLRRGLVATMGSADAAAAEWERLKQVAKAPGIDFEGAIQGSISLQQVGMSADEAASSLFYVANALATVGKGAEQMKLVNWSLTQMMAKTGGIGDELRELQGNLPQIRIMLQRAFGTSDTAELSKMGIQGRDMVRMIIKELAKLPLMTAGPRVAFDNLGDAVKRSMAIAGEAILTRLLPYINEVSNVLRFMEESGIIKRVAEGFTGLFGDSQKGADSLAYSLINLSVSLEQLPEKIRMAFDTVRLAWYFVKELFLVTADAVWYVAEACMKAGRWVVNLADYIGYAVEKVIAATARLFGNKANESRANAEAQAALDRVQPVDWGKWHNPLSATISGTGQPSWDAAKGRFVWPDEGNGAASDEVAKRWKAYKEAREKYAAENPAAGIQPPGGGEGGQKAGGGFSGWNWYLAQIAQNTRDMADNFQRMIVGGGQRGKWGVTASEIAAGRTGGTNVYVQTGMSSEQFKRHFRTMQRQGA